MRRFTSLCFDKTTGAEMVLYDCSYNAACMFLENANRNNCLGEFQRAECKSHNIVHLIFEKAVYIYDEDRGCLMRETN